MDALPGMTQCSGDACQVNPAVKMYDIAKTEDREIVIITTAIITKERVFTNGLYQNIVVLYRMFNAMGYLPILLINEPPTLGTVPDCMLDFRIVFVDELVKRSIPIKYLLEIGMSIDAAAKKYMKMIGARIIKIYLGNILNIDIETSIFYPSVDFPHHVASGTDKILVSPHYGQHSEYAVAVNGEKPQELSQSIAPYVWDPVFLSEGGVLPQWQPPAGAETLVIMEPNISFQKTGIIPLLALERWYKKNKGWTGKLLLFNSERVTISPHFQKVYQNRMDLFADGKVELYKRQDIKSVLSAHPTATFLCHQVNNEFNYMFLELMWVGFPVIHNIATWRNFGYYYQGSNLDDLANALNFSRMHSTRIDTYRAHAHTLAWRYSPYNPAVQEAWRSVLT
jgi:hypothetical protein